MKRTLFVPALAVAGLLAAVGCSEEETPAATPTPTEEPKKVEIPPYAPTGEHADAMKAAAADITADNAAEKAKALEAQLDEALKSAEGAKEGAEGEGK